MLPTEYQQFIHLSRYARWDYEKGRRETWDETIERYFDFFTQHLEKNHKFDIPERIVDEAFSIIWKRDMQAKKDNQLDEDDKELNAELDVVFEKFKKSAIYASCSRKR